MTKKNIITACKWTFTACAVAAAISGVMKGNLAEVIWPVMAAALNWIALSFEERTSEIMDEYEKLIEHDHSVMLEAADVIEKQDAEIAALKEEINRLKCR